MKIIIRTVALSIIVALLLPITAFAASPEDMNAEQTAREREITALLDERQEILLTDPVDIELLNNVDLELYEFGVDFLPEEVVAENFPEAKAAVDGGIATAVIDNPSTISVSSVEVPDSNTNS